MDQPSETLALKEYQRACKSLAEHNVLHALAALETALRYQDTPQWHSMLGFCIAKERGHVTRGSALCQAAMSAFPDDPQHWYYYGRVLLLAGQKVAAIEVLRQGLSRGDSPEIKQLLHELGVRKSPVIAWLQRDNPVNKCLGIVLARLGLR